MKNWKVVLEAKRLLSDAYQTLNDAKQRKLYDAFLLEIEDQYGEDKDAMLINFRTALKELMENLLSLHYPGNKHQYPKKELEKFYDNMLEEQAKSAFIRDNMAR